MSNIIVNFISNNVKGIQSYEKRLNIFEYLKNNIHHNDFAFFQETQHKMKKSGKMISKILCFFQIVLQILVE